MYNHLAGKLTEKNPAYVVIECNGIGFHINISLNTYSQLPDTTTATVPSPNSPLPTPHCTLYIHQQITEDAQTLWGFADEDERRLFRQLISVNGVGCNTARMMLSSMSPTEIQDAIITENVGKLKSIKGIGEKTAQRIIIDLKTKVRKEGVSITGLTSQLKVKQEAIAALTSLGFAKPSVERVIDSLARNNDNTITVETLIKSALKTL